MIQFNLLPDIKVNFIRTQRVKRVVLVVAIAIAAFSVALLLLLFSYSAVQNQHLSNLNDDIKKLTTELEEIEELDKILSVQNQLVTLPALYEGRPAVDRLAGYVDQTTPTTVKLNEYILDFSLSTIEITGTSESLEAVNSFVDTLKYTTFHLKTDEKTEVPAFTNVVLSEFSRDEEEATFNIELVFNPLIFDVTQDVTLTVPSIVTTRAQAPSGELFKVPEAEKED